MPPPSLLTLDWGSVPAWLGAGSLLLAFRIFWRDRSNAERSQVDLVGAWGTTEYERRAPDISDRVEKVSVTSSSEMQANYLSKLHSSPATFGRPGLSRMVNSHTGPSLASNHIGPLSTE